MDSKSNKILQIIILLILLLILLYLLIRSFGHIEHRGPLVPTGNVDIFEIECECCNNENDVSVFNSDDTDKNKLKDNTNENQSDNTQEHSDIVVFDDYKIWDNKDLRIFSNPAYEYESIIAPGSYNSYAFVIRNNNDFDVVVDIVFSELNEKNINMKFKLKNNGNYLFGTNDNYEPISGKKIEDISLPAKSQKAYILDWKWIDSDNDTEIGFDASSTYKLSIEVGAN